MVHGDALRGQFRSVTVTAPGYRAAPVHTGNGVSVHLLAG